MICGCLKKIKSISRYALCKYDGLTAFNTCTVINFGIRGYGECIQENWFQILFYGKGGCLNLYNAMYSTQHNA